MKVNPCSKLECSSLIAQLNESYYHQSGLSFFFPISDGEGGMAMESQLSLATGIQPGNSISLFNLSYFGRFSTIKEKNCPKQTLQIIKQFLVVTCWCICFYFCLGITSEIGRAWDSAGFLIVLPCKVNSSYNIE